MDNTYRILLAKVQRDLVEAQKRVDDLVRLEKYLVEICGGSANESHDKPVEPRPATLKGLTQERAAVEVLKATRGPLKTRQIVELMIESGFEKPENMMHLINSVYGALNKSERARKIDRGTWEYLDSAHGSTD